ncbi:hypothetical protein D9M70_408930 [compost metagenome]
MWLAQGFSQFLQRVRSLVESLDGDQRQAVAAIFPGGQQSPHLVRCQLLASRAEARLARGYAGLHRVIVAQWRTDTFQLDAETVTLGQCLLSHLVITLDAQRGREQPQQRRLRRMDRRMPRLAHRDLAPTGQRAIEA